MNFQERKRIILSAIGQKSSISVKELAELLNTSEITIRRDLGILAEQGQIFRTHGGAMKIEFSTDKVSFANKVASKIEEKRYICQLAAQLIEENDIIFLDCGSTIFLLCEFIKNKKIKVVTNSLPVLYELIDSTVSVNLLGGEVDKERLAVHGTIAREHIGRYKANKAFIGIDGISLKNGLSANSEKEAEIANAMATNAKKVFLLCDSTKFENDKYLSFAPIELIDTIITDKNADESILEVYRAKGIKVLN